MADCTCPLSLIWTCTDRILRSTRFIVDAIAWLYGLVFAGCCAALAVIVFFFLNESKDRSLEEIDTMYITRVNPITSAKWKAVEGGEGGAAAHKENAQEPEDGAGSNASA